MWQLPPLTSFNAHRLPGPLAPTGPSSSAFLTFPRCVIGSQDFLRRLTALPPPAHLWSSSNRPCSSSAFTALLAPNTSPRVSWGSNCCQCWGDQKGQRCGVTLGHVSGGVGRGEGGYSPAQGSQPTDSHAPQAQANRPAGTWAPPLLHV